MTVASGLSEVISSWKIIEIWLPRSARSRPFLSRRSSPEHFPKRSVRAEAISRRMESGVAAAGFADHRRLALAHAERDAVACGTPSGKKWVFRS
jgi:hypothetical protein